MEPDSDDFLAYADRIDLVVECLQERGYAASSYMGFGVMAGGAGGDIEEATRVEGECWEEVEERFPSPPPLSMEETYYYLLDVAECLRDEGYEIPDPPSLETYLDAVAAQEDSWDPYGYLGRRGVDTWALQSGVCPLAPWFR